MDILERKARYSALSTVSIALWAFLGWRFTFFMDGSYTCSGLVARCLLAIGAIFNQDVVKVTPAQLAISFRAPVPQVPAGGARARRRGLPPARCVRPVRPWRAAGPRRDRS